MTLKTPKEQAITDLAILFSTDMPGVLTASYNDSEITVIDESSGTEEDSNSVFNFLDILVQNQDAPAITYLTDTLIMDGNTWRYPKIINQDARTKKIRFIRNQRPKVR